MSRPLPVRQAVPGDAAALARLRYQFRAAIDPPEESESDFVERCSVWMASRLTEAGGWRAWVVDDPRAGARSRATSGTASAAHILSGMVWLDLIEKLPNPVAEPEWHGYITSLYVQPALQGGGLGSALLAAALAECDRRGVDAVILWPTPRSRTLYERHGFAVRDDLMERRR